jgi:hypothetical protein
MGKRECMESAIEPKLLTLKPGTVLGRDRITNASDMVLHVADEVLAHDTDM